MSEHEWTCGKCGVTAVRTHDYAVFLGVIQSHPAHCMAVESGDTYHLERLRRNPEAVARIDRALRQRDKAVAASIDNLGFLLGEEEDPS